jgi:hypothetical protein
MKALVTTIAAVSLFAFVGIAHAVVLTTAPAQDNFSGSDGVNCTIANVGTATALITINVYDYAGNIITSTPSAMSLNAGRVTSLFENTGGAYCEFISNKTTVRAAAIYRDSSFSLGMAIVAR